MDVGGLLERHRGHAPSQSSEREGRVREKDKSSQKSFPYIFWLFLPPTSHFPHFSQFLSCHTNFSNTVAHTSSGWCLSIPKQQPLFLCVPHPTQPMYSELSCTWRVKPVLTEATNASPNEISKKEPPLSEPLLSEVVKGRGWGIRRVLESCWCLEKQCRK